MLKGKGLIKMQTFLPYPNFAMCARVLDDKRLGKQRVEAKQILDILEGRSKTKYWRNHPAVRMWKGHSDLLKHYINAMITEWELRGFKNNMSYENASNRYSVPKWLFDRRLIYSHRTALVRKNPGYYGKKWRVKDVNAPYWWPVPLKNESQNKKMKEYWEKN
jgi:hypothetical protein